MSRNWKGVLAKDEFKNLHLLVYSRFIVFNAIAIRCVEYVYVCIDCNAAGASDAASLLFEIINLGLYEIEFFFGLRFGVTPPMSNSSSTKKSR